MDCPCGNSPPAKRSPHRVGRSEEQEGPYSKGAFQKNTCKMGVKRNKTRFIALNFDMEDEDPILAFVSTHRCGCATAWLRDRDGIGSYMQKGRWMLQLILEMN